jgi:hypothetical protein
MDTRDQTALYSLTGAGAGAQAGPGAPDIEKIFKGEVENLLLAEGMYKWVGDGIEDRVLGLFGKPVASGR